MYKDGNLVNEKNKKVMDIAGNRDTQHNNIGVYRRHNKLNQQFDIVYVDDMPRPTRRGEMDEEWGLRVDTPFHIVSGLGGGRYLQNLGRELVIKTPNGYDEQMWWFDIKTKTIKSWKNKGWSLDIQGAGRQSNMKAWNTNSGWW
jgi:hypothetical protein